MKVKIYYHHTDSGGVVYYANYLKFLEEARTEFLEESNISIKELIKEGIQFVVARQEIDYKAPAYYGDILEIDTHITKASIVKMVFEYKIKNQHGNIISTARTILACINKDFKAQPIPDEIKNKLEQLV